MVRSSAKNYRFVAIVTDPADYAALVTEMQANGGALTDATRFNLAKKAFSHTAEYDGAISNYLTALNDNNEREAFGEKLNLQFTRAQTCRYGENPHQAGAFYVEANAPAGTISTARQIQGKELSATTTSPTPTPRSSASSSSTPPRPASSSSTPTPAASPTAPTCSKPTTAPTRPIPNRPSAASSPSTAASTAPPLPPSSSASSSRSSSRPKSARKPAQRSPPRRTCGCSNAGSGRAAWPSST